MNNDFSVGIAEEFPQALIQVELACCQIETGGLGFPGIDLLLKRHCHCHRSHLSPEVEPAIAAFILTVIQQADRALYDRR
jgi:hypothetical protein